MKWTYVRESKLFKWESLFLFTIEFWYGARGSAVIKALCYEVQAGMSRVRDPMRRMLFAALGHSACNRNEYQKQKNNVSGEQSVASG
jgi:hypothetical protein